MKNTGIIRRIDDLGRIVIPKEIRARFEWKENDPIEIMMDDKGIFLTKYRPLETIIKDEMSRLADAFRIMFKVDIIVAEDTGAVLKTTIPALERKMLEGEALEFCRNGKVTAESISFSANSSAFDVAWCCTVRNPSDSRLSRSLGAVFVCGDDSKTGAKIAETIAEVLSRRLADFG